MKIRKNISNKLSEKDAFIKITNDILEDVLTVEEALELYPVIPESNYKEKWVVINSLSLWSCVKI